jgi:polyhydroxybutyrate depolymerase
MFPMPRQRFFLATAALVLLALACRQNAAPIEPQPAPIENAGQTTADEIESGGVTRTYLIHIPANARADQPAPLILNFHGLTSNGREQELLSGMSQAAEAYGAFVVYPDGLDEHWNVAPGREGDADLRFFRDLILTLQSEYPLDPKRIYATGISNGGGMANRLACETSDLIAAIAPVAGAYNAWKNCRPARPVPVLAFHGLDDQIAPYEGVGRGNVEPPIREWAFDWAKRNGCAPAPASLSRTVTVTVEKWQNCKARSVVILYTLANHGHSWPGTNYLPAAITSNEVNATDLILQFFQNHRLP